MATDCVSTLLARRAKSAGSRLPEAGIETAAAKIPSSLPNPGGNAAQRWRRERRSGASPVMVGAARDAIGEKEKSGRLGRSCVKRATDGRFPQQLQECLRHRSGRAKLLAPAIRLAAFLTKSYDKA